MKSGEKKLIVILIIITLIVIGIKVKMNKNSEQNSEDTQMNVSENDNETRMSTSEKLKEEKTYGVFKLTNFSVTYRNNQTQVTATVTNSGSNKENEKPISLVLLDESGSELVKMGAYIGTTESGESRKLVATISGDYTGAYDIEIRD